MISERLLIVFPYLPLTALMLAAACRFTTGRDASRPFLRLAQWMQLATGTTLMILFALSDGAAWEVPLSVWHHSILLRFDSWKMYFMAAYLLPLLLSLLVRDEWSSPTLRFVFMFYLGGCSALIVAGDVFNFFVAYELMIMSAYVLVAARGRYLAAVRYMFFGAASSAPLLAGIIVLYGSSGTLIFPDAATVAAMPAANLAWMLFFFSIAFMIKAAFFPVSGWVAPCHSATVPVMSAFLGSFTIFSGIYGLTYLVVQPALAGGFEAPLMFLRIMSLATLLAAGLFLFYESDIKRCVAGSTVYTIGGVGLLLSYGMYGLALAYLSVHAAFKSALFMIVARIETGDGLRVRGHVPYLLAGAAASAIVAGLYPGMVHFLKLEIGAYGWVDVSVGLISMGMLLGGFLKFQYRLIAESGAKRYKRWFWPVFVVTAALMYTLIFARFQASISWKAILQWSLAVVATLLAGGIYRRTIRFANLDRRLIFKNLNVELFFIMLLLAAGAVAILVD